jgi:hypothetical protein
MSLSTGTIPHLSDKRGQCLYPLLAGRYHVTNDKLAVDSGGASPGPALRGHEKKGVKSWENVA